MLDNTTLEIHGLRETAVKLIRCVGAKAALDYCRHQHWHGLYDEVRTLSAASERSR